MVCFTMSPSRLVFHKDGIESLASCAPLLKSLSTGPCLPRATFTPPHIYIIVDWSDPFLNPLSRPSNQLLAININWAINIFKISDQFFELFMESG